MMHSLAVELFRPHIIGPTAGAIRLNDVYGVLALVLGRGLYGLVAIIPIGIVFGICDAISRLAGRHAPPAFVAGGA